MLNSAMTPNIATINLRDMSARVVAIIYDRLQGISDLTQSEAIGGTRNRGRRYRGRRRYHRRADRVPRRLHRGPHPCLLRAVARKPSVWTGGENVPRSSP